MRALTCSAFVLLVFAGCNHAAESTAKATPPDVGRLSAGTSLAGRVHVGGTAELPEVVLHTDDGSAMRMVGEYEAELHALSGADVRVSGAPVDNVPGGALRVSSYSVTTIDGVEPFVGILSSGDEALTLADGTMLRLIGLPSSVHAADGAKVWVTGERSGSELRVRSAGIIRR